MMMPRNPFTLLILALSSFLVGIHATPAVAADKPAIIFVPGAFHKAAVFDEVKRQLSSAGYTELNAIDLPSVGLDAASIDRRPDFSAVQKAINQQLAKGKDVVLVGNSYGCTVIGDGVKDFEDRSIVKNHASGNGKILGIVMLAGFIPYINEPTISHPDIRTISPPWFRFEGTSLVYWDGDLTSFPPSHTFYNLLPPAEATYWSSQLAPSSFAATNATAQYIPYDGKFRTLYVISEHDNTVSLELSRSFIDQPGAKFEVQTIDADHIAMLSRPAKVVEIIRCFVKEGGYAC